MKIERPVGRLCGAVALTAVSLCFATGVALGANASPPEHPISESVNRYDRCLDLVKRDPTRASAEAASWSGAGGGAAALHCQALALVELKRFPEAAQKLEDAAANAAPSLRAELLDQAGNAWLLAGNAAKAEAALTSALALDPKNEDILSDRARERGEARNWTGAFADLTAVLAVDPDRADIYVLRASALHAEGRKADARADIARALGIYPDYPEALIERGTMRLEAGDRAGARADWQQAEREAPDSDAAMAARARLAQLAALSEHQKRKQN